MNPLVHTLTRQSRAHHLSAGARVSQCCEVADAEHAPVVDAFVDTWGRLCPDLRVVEVSEMRARVPILRAEAVSRVVEDPNTLALDAYGLLEGFRRALTGAGGRVVSNARVTAIERTGGSWRLRYGERGDASLDADVVVNAAGAWGDEVAVLAGLEPLGLQPFRRTALLLDPSQDVSGWPMVHRAQGGLYFKPEAGLLMVSLGDETPSPPCDARPEELDIALILDRFQEMTTVEAVRPVQTWAGLRTFLPDRHPAVGYDPAVDDFFWLVGQGGFGMQTAPALSLLAGDLLAGRDHPLAAAVAPGRSQPAAG
jgi:D-arginine dehydrogenase